MKRYKVISFDMFQTLVNLNARVSEIWQGILEEEYSEEKCEIGAEAIFTNLPPAYRKAINPFMTMEEVFMECAASVVKQTGYDVTPYKVAYNLMYQHGQAPFYEESLDVIKKLKEKYSVIISSDASPSMVEPLLAQINADKAFISDDIRCYKGETSGKFFKIVLSELNIKPDEMLHVGDSFADIVGAKNAGIDACWINRDNRVWNHTLQPDYIIHNLNEILDICGEKLDLEKIIKKEK